MEFLFQFQIDGNYAAEGTLGREYPSKPALKVDPGIKTQRSRRTRIKEFAREEVRSRQVAGSHDQEVGQRRRNRIRQWQ